MQSIEEIYKNHANMIFKYLMSLCGNQHIAEELTQETFYQAIKCINKFDKTCKITTWLCSIAKNQYLAYVRKHPPSEDIDLIDLQTASTEDKVIQNINNVAQSPSGIDFLLAVFSPKKTVNLNRSLNTDTNSFDRLTHNNKTYKYKLILTGRSPNAACDSQYTVLSNDKSLTFQTVDQSVYTSNSDRFLDPDVAVIIDMKTLDKGLK